ncbi:MAG: hypothetical protein ACLRV7_04870 [Hoylesella buccalis]
MLWRTPSPSGWLSPIVNMPEGGGNAPPLGLEAVGVIDLVQWLAVAGIRACCGATTVQLCRGDERSQRLFLRGRGLAERK